jgi:type III secretion protein C
MTIKNYWNSFKKSLQVMLSIGYLATLCTPLAAQQNPLSLKHNEREETYTIKFNNISVVELLNYVGRIAERNFIYDEQQLHFNISVMSDAPATATEILSLIIDALKLNGLSIIEEGQNLLIYAPGEKELKFLPKVVTNSMSNRQGKEALVTKIFKLKYADPTKIAQIISGLATDTDQVQVNQETRHIIVADLAVNIERIEEMVQALDQIESLIEVDIYKVKHTNISALKNFAQRIIEPLTANASSETESGTSGVTIIPNLSTNSLYLISSRQYIDKTLNILSSLDVPSELEIIANSRLKEKKINPHTTNPAEILDRQINPEFYIYKLQYHRGDGIVTSLKNITDGLKTEGDTLDPKLAYSISTMQWIASTNSLIFSGDDASIIKLKNLIASLDTPVKQVFIEALIVDTTITNSLDFGVDIGAQFTWADQRHCRNFWKYRNLFFFEYRY